MRPLIVYLHPAVDSSLSQASSFSSAFLGMFTKLQKAPIGLVMSVCLSVCMEQLGSHWADFHEI
jgi:hypothetical protein